MCGDNAPEEIVKGACLGSAAHDVDLLLVGDEKVIGEIISRNKLPCDRVEIVNNENEPITMEDDPSCVMKEKKDSSMPHALRLLSEGAGDAVVSAGNTGALFTGATLIVRRIKGMRRAALGAIVPLGKPMLIVDSGANTDVLPENLCDFALMGDLYMRQVLGIENPKIGLINNGAEEHKGTDLYVKTHAQLKNLNINFIGNIEGRDVPSGVCDVIVCDGFTGNILLKTCEGFGLFIKKTLKGIFYESIMTKLGALFVKAKIDELKRAMDYSEFGGAPFFGISKPVIKAHGSANAKSVSYCILQAKKYASSGMIEKFTDLAQNPEKYEKQV